MLAACAVIVYEESKRPKAVNSQLFPGSVHAKCLCVSDIVVFEISGAFVYCVGPLFNLVLAFLHYLFFGFFPFRKIQTCVFLLVVF